jgi:uncharacterized protein YlxW (UPF0749 family)
MTFPTQLITTITNFEQITEVENQVQQIKIKIMDKINEIEQDVIQLDQKVLELQNEVDLLRKKTADLQKIINAQLLDPYNMIAQGMSSGIMLLFIISWIMQ